MSHLNEDDVLGELSELIETLTTSGSQKLDESRFKRVKLLCKKSDENVRHLYRMVMTQLEKRHSEIRLSALQIINEIFLRSHAFRELLVDDFDRFFSLTTGINSKQSLPGPTAVASKLRTDALKAIEKWHQSYGPHYMKLELGYKYLKKVKKVNFTGSQPHTEIERLRADDIETRRANVAQQKLDSVMIQMSETVAEIQNIITEMSNCFCLILPKPEEFEIQPTNPNSDRHTETPCTSTGVTNAILDDHGLSSRSFQLTIPISNVIEIKESPDNVDVVSTMRELHKQLVDKYLPLTQKWLEILTRHSGNKERLVQAIDLKSSLTDLKYKYDKLRIISSNVQKNDDEFIDVPEKEGVEHIPESRWHEYGLETGKRKFTPHTDIDPRDGEKSKISWNPNGNSSSIGDPSARATAIASLLRKHETKINKKTPKYKAGCTITKPSDTKNPIHQSPVSNGDKRTELLEQAPVVPYGMDLYNWERDDDESPSVSDLKSLHCYWTRPNEENENHCPGDMMESMKSRSISFSGEFQEIKWTCRAPLPNGKLCPRKDRFKCPFHGKIVPRDEMGKPECGTSGTDVPMCNSGQELAEVTRDIELATGMDLGSTKGKKRRKQGHSGLTDLKKNSNTSRTRLEKIVLNKESLKRVSAEKNRIKKRLLDEKYGNNWNYALKEGF